MASYLLTSCLSWVLIFTLGTAAHKARCCRLSLLLVSCVGYVRQILPLTLIVLSSIWAPFDVLGVVRFRLYDEGSHIIFNVLLHEQVILTILVQHLLLIVPFHYFIHSVILVEVETLLLIHMIVFVGHLLAVLFQEVS